MTATGRAHEWDDSYTGQAPPWDIGRPQPAFLHLADAGALNGALLDAGCGTGEHTILAACRGAVALGIDVSPRRSRSPGARPLSAGSRPSSRCSTRCASTRSASPSTRSSIAGCSTSSTTPPEPGTSRPSMPLSVQAVTFISCASATVSPVTGAPVASPKASCALRSAPAGASTRSPPTASTSTPASALLPPKRGWPTFSGSRPGSGTEGAPRRRLCGTDPAHSVSGNCDRTWPERSSRSIATIPLEVGTHAGRRS